MSSEIFVIMRILPGEVEDGLHVSVHQFPEGGIVAGFTGFYQGFVSHVTYHYLHFVTVEYCS